MRTKYSMIVMAVAVFSLLTSGHLRASEMDDRIKLAAVNSYVFQAYLKGDEITIESKDGVVTLTGTVLEEFDKSLAQETVASLPGVKRVDNRLERKGERLIENSDAWITAKVKTALLFRRNVNASKTEVLVRDGVVILRGDAASHSQIELSTEYALNVDGVKDVKNEMTVSQTSEEAYETEMRGKIDDASITAQVRMALLFHRSTSVLNTNVDTGDGVVTLRGVARSVSEKGLVSDLVGDIKGVRGVKNEMSIGGAQ